MTQLIPAAPGLRYLTTRQIIELDDYLATANETIWLNPLGARSPFRAVRLELTRRTQQNIDRFLTVLAALADCLGAQLRLVESDGVTGEPTTIANVRQELEASLGGRTSTGKPRKRSC